MSHVAYVAIGSNMGDRRENCRRGVEAIDKEIGCRVTAQSPLYETEPVGMGTHEGWFINGVICVTTFLSPEILMLRLLAIESAMGRRRGEAGVDSRPLDLDILFYDEVVLTTGVIRVPHPRLHERRFVLMPLCDIASDLIHPVLGRSVHNLLADLVDGNKEVHLHKCDSSFFV